MQAKGDDKVGFLIVPLIFLPHLCMKFSASAANSFGRMRCVPATIVAIFKQDARSLYIEILLESKGV